MRACIQRVSQAQVSIAGEVVGHIGAGILVLLGVAEGDNEQDVRQLAAKILELRIFDDEDGKMNRSLLETQGAALIVSQFTLLGDCRKGRRPSYSAAAAPEVAERLYELFAETIRAAGVEAATGRFRQHMEVSLTNSGPVTLLLDSRKQF